MASSPMAVAVHGSPPSERSSARPSRSRPSRAKPTIPPRGFRTLTRPGAHAVAAFCGSLPLCHAGVSRDRNLGPIHHDLKRSVQHQTQRRCGNGADERGDALCPVSRRPTHWAAVSSRSQLKLPIGTTIAAAFVENWTPRPLALGLWIAQAKTATTKVVALIP